MEVFVFLEQVNKNVRFFLVRKLILNKCDVVYKIVFNQKYFVDFVKGGLGLM